MPRTQLIESVDQFGGVLVEIETAFHDADYSQVLDAAVDDIKELERGYFQSETDPTGSAWAPLAPSTIKRKGHEKILIDSDRMRASLVDGTSDTVDERVDNGDFQQLTYGTSVEYTIHHQEGTERMPARPPVGVTDKFVDQLAATVADAAVAALFE